MDCKTLIDYLETGPEANLAEQAIRENKGEPGLSHEFSARVQGYFGTNGESALRLSEYSNLVLKHVGDPQWSYRAQALGLWLKGDFSKSADAFLRSGSLVSDREEQIGLSLGALDAFARGGQIEQALTIAREWLAYLRDSGVLAAKIHLSLGSVLTQVDRHEEAFEEFARAREASADLDPGHRASIVLGLSTTALATNRIDLALKAAGEAADAFDEQGADDWSQMAQINVGLAQLLSGETTLALSTWRQVRDRFSGAMSSERARLEELIGDAFFELNRFDEAIVSYNEALRLVGSKVTPRSANAVFGIVVSQRRLNQGQWEAGLKRAARNFKRLGNARMALECGLILAEQDVRQGRFTNATRRLNRIRAGALQADWRRLQARSELLLCSVAVALGKPAQKRLADLSEFLKSNELPFLQWRVSYLQALAAEGDEKGSFFQQMLKEILEVRLLLQTSAGLTRFYDDKIEALEAYMEWLLRSRGANAADELIEVFASSRAVTLLDEVLAQQFRPEFRERLQGLRRKLSGTEDGGESDGGFREYRIKVKISPPLLREIQLLRNEIRVRRTEAGRPSSGCATLWRRGDDVVALSPGRAEPISFGHLQTKEWLHKFHFELLQPLLGAEEGHRTEKLLNEFRSRFSFVRERAICPDSQLWTLPWHLMREGAETAIRLSPMFSANAENLTLPKAPKVAIWLGMGAPKALEEAKWLQDQFPGSRLMSTAREARESLDQEWDVVHVAAHAVHLPGFPELSGIKIGEDLISSDEVASHGLKAKFAVLLACFSGRVSAEARLEPHGAVRSFLQAGTNAAIGSAWELSGEASLVFAREFYSALVRGFTLNEAIFAARMETKKKMKHLFYWGAPVLFEGAGPNGGSA